MMHLLIKSQCSQQQRNCNCSFKMRIKRIKNIYMYIHMHIYHLLNNKIFMYKIDNSRSFIQKNDNMIYAFQFCLILFLLMLKCQNV